MDLSSYFEIKYKGEVPDVIFEGYMDENRENYTSYFNYSDKYKDEEGYEPLASVLELHYYKVNADGTTEELKSAPSELGSYKVQAVIPNITDKNGVYAIYPTWDDENSNAADCIYYYGGAESKLVNFEIAVQPEGLQLVYGDKNLKDEDALVLSVFGDGFKEDEQAAFYNAAKETAEYIMQYSPYDEFKDTIKFYAYGTVSNESGARADKATTQEEADKDTRDTYFGTSFWDSGMQRLVALGKEGEKKIEALNKEYIPTSDFSIVVVNSTTYGGSGGEYCIASLNSSSLDMMVHELGHTVPGLLDEYYAAGFEEECANLTADSDLNNVEQADWKRFVGKNGIGVYPIEETQKTDKTWYRPHQSCAMRYLGYDFCEVCKEAHRKAFCKYSNVTKIFFQTYADEFITGEMPDMSQYIILRRGENEITGDQIEEGKLTLTYKDSEGNVLNSAPNEVGTYTISASFSGDDTYDAVTLPDSEYTIEYPKMKKFAVESKTCDGEPAEITCDTGIEDFNENDYEIIDSYTGTLKITGEARYDSEEAPVQPGTYTLKRTIKDKSGKIVCVGTADFTISYKVTTLADNDEPTDYPGAANYYNNQDIIIFGEGFTKDEQDEFDKKAKELYEYIISQEPFKETKLYFNFKSFNTVSNVSGISETKKDTYFKMMKNEDGTLPDFPSYAVSASGYCAYRETGGYYKAAIILVNDEVSGGAVSNDKTRIYIAAGSDEAGRQYVAQQLINFYAGKDTSYTGCTEDDRLALLGRLYYRWAGEEYPLIVSRAYDETFLYSGEPVDLTDYFETYVGTKKMTPSKGYKLTYYKDNNGEPGEELGGAPSEVGTYHAKIEFVTETGTFEDGEEYQFATLLDADGNQNEYPAMPARGWTTFTIKSVQDKIANAEKYLTQAKEALANNNIEQANEYLQKAEEAMKEAEEVEGVSFEQRKELSEALKEAQKQAAEAAEQSAKDKAAAEEAIKKAEEALKEAEAAKKEAEIAKKKAANQVATVKFKAKKARIKSVKKSGKKALKVTWKAVSGAKGYQIQYSKKSNFKNAKTVTVKKASTKTKTIKKLTSKKRYYVRVRAYKTIGGKKVYTSWSTKKSVKVK